MTSGEALGKDVAGFVLAGGKSLRMGSDKALALFRGEPLIANALAIVRAAGYAASISGSRPDLSSFAEQIPDTFRDAGPLGGIHAALASPIAAEWNMFLPVDMPLLPPQLLTTLMERATRQKAVIAACTLSGKLQPFPVVLHKSVLPQIERCLQAGLTACYSAWEEIPSILGSTLETIPAESLIPPSYLLDVQPAAWFESANTPAILARLSRIAEENALARRHSQVI